MKNESTRKVINVDKPNYVPLFEFKELDNAVIRLSLFKASVEFDITGQTVKLGAKTSKGLKEQSEGFTINKNNLDIDLKNSILVPGTVEIDLELKDASGTMTTASFFITVKSKVLNDKAVEGTNEFDTFTKTAAKIEEDYKGLRRIIIDENQAANLQDQVNQTNAQLETKAKKEEVQNVQQQVNNLVLNGDGSQNLEVVQSRTDFKGNTFATLNDRNKNIERILNEKKSELIFSNWEIGNIIDGIDIENNKYIRTGIINIPVGTKLYITPNTDYYIKCIYYDESNTYVKTLPEKTVSQVITIEYQNVRFAIRKANYPVVSINDRYGVQILTDFDFNIEEYDNKNIFSYENINLFNGNLTSGSLSSSGVIVANSNWRTTDFIKFSINDVINTNITTKFVGENNYKLFIYDLSENFIEVKTTPYFPIIIDKNCLIRFCIHINDSNFSNIQIQKEYKIFESGTKKSIQDFSISVDEINGFEGKVKELINNNIPNVNIDSKLKNIKIALLGDSYTAEKTSKSYPQLISERTGCIILNHGESGSCVTKIGVFNGNSVESFIKRFGNIENEIDILGIFGGINDSTSVTVGTIDDVPAENSTFYAGYKLLLKMALEKYSNAKIVCIIPPQIPGYVKLHKDIVPAIKECCNLYSIPYLDLDSKFSYSNVNKELYKFERYLSHNAGTVSNIDIHLNLKGKLEMSYLIQNFLENQFC